MRRSTTLLGTLILSIAGSLLAAYLTYSHLFASGQCSAGGNCEKVLRGDYSTLAGIPISAFGLGLCLAVSYCAWRSLSSAEESGRFDLLLALSAAGVLPIPYLIYLQAYVLQSWCVYCLSLSAILLAALILLLRDQGTRGKQTLPTVECLAALTLILIPPLTAKATQAGIAQIKASGHGNPVVATIGERNIHLDELKRAIQLELYTKEDELRDAWLEQEILKTAAQERDLTLDEYVIQEVYGSVEVTESEIRAFYEQVRHDIPDSQTFDDVRQGIRNKIGTMKGNQALAEHVDQLKARFGYIFTLPPFERFMVDPDTRGAPTYGSEDAPVTLVVFSDFNCFHCARAHQELFELVEKHEGKIRLVYKHYPVYSDDMAEQSARIAACAHLQGKFWNVADILFESEIGEFNDSTLESLAARAGLDPALLKQQMNDSMTADIVTADIEEGRALGIYATPSLFINGRYIGYAPPEELEPMILTELEFAE